MLERVGDSLLWWPEAAVLGATVATSTRHGGVSVGPYASLNLGLHVHDDPDAVVANREQVASDFGVDLANVVFAEQVHGAGVTVVDRSHAGRGARRLDDAVAESDALVTTTPGLTLVMLVADCLPLVLIDPEARVLAVVHAGWRGTAAGVSNRAISAMCELGARPARVHTYLGPAVHPDLYQVDDPVRTALADAVAPEMLAHGVARPDGPGHWRVDLVAANRQQLGLAGVSSSAIASSELSTNDEAYFSDRATRPCGRFALLAQLAG